MSISTRAETSPCRCRSAGHGGRSAALGLGAAGIRRDLGLFALLSSQSDRLLASR